MASITVYPASYDSTNYSYQSVVSNYPLTNPIGKGSTSTSMCRVNLKTGSKATSYLFYKFDLSAIPANATIDSVACKVKCYINQTNSSRIATRQVQMYYGINTAKGTASTMSTSTTALNITCGTWTRAELDDCRIRLYVVRGTSNTTTTYYMGLYGADLTVQYTEVSGEKMMIKTSGTWTPVTKVYKKINGVWVEQTDLKNIFDVGVNYQKAN